VSSWAEDVKRRSVAEVAVALGLEVDARRRALSPCPACGLARRHPKRKDPRGAVGLTPDGLGFRCFECDAHGDAVTLAALVARDGSVPGRGDRAAWAEVAELCASRGLCELEAGERRARMPQDRRSAPRTMVAPRPVAPLTGTPALARLPASEVLALWRRCAAVVEDAEVRTWIEGRGLDAELVAERELARALPKAGALPAWCRCAGVSWREGGYRVLVPLYGPGGRMEALHARTVAPGREPKAAFPAGASVGGLVMADALGRELLRGAPPPGPPGRVMVAEVMVAEGVPDYLTWATQYGDADEDAPAVLGVISGSFPEIAAAIPTGSRVYVTTHHDQAGDKYAETIRASLAGRCAVLRSPKP
jgi:hypothetical protein